MCEFDGLEYRGGTPTDIDALFEFHNTAYVIMELKAHRADMPKGQRMCLECMANDFTKAGKKALVIVGEHYEEPTESIAVANCTVREVFYNGHWYRGQGETLRERMMGFLEFVDRGKNDYRRALH